MSATMMSRLRFCGIMLLTQHFLLPLRVIRVLLTNRCSPFELTREFCKITGVELILSGRSKKPSSERKTMYLCNHRSWADFVIDSVLTSGSTYLARYLVAFFLPWSFIYSQLTGNIMFFRRKRGINRAELSRWMAAKWSSHCGLLVYPEGTRNQRMRSLPLKTGVLDAALHIGCPVQCVITTNKENVLDETRMKAQSGVRCRVSYSRVVDAASFRGRRKAFFDEVQNAWDEAWNDAYARQSPKLTSNDDDDDHHRDIHLSLSSSDNPPGKTIVPRGVDPYYGPPNAILAWALRAALILAVFKACRSPWFRMMVAMMKRGKNKMLR